MKLDALRRAALAGVPGASEALARALRSELLRFFRRRVDEHVAEELVQETVLAVLLALDVEPERSYRGWVYGIARHKLLGHWNAQTRARELGPQLAAIEAPQRSVSSVVAERERAELVDAGIEQLDPDFRRALEDELADGDPRAFAKTEGIADTTARTRRYRARQSVKRHVDAQRKTPSS